MNEYEVESYQGIYLHISCVIGFNLSGSADPVSYTHLTLPTKA